MSLGLGRDSLGEFQDLEKNFWYYSVGKLNFETLLASS